MVKPASTSPSSAQRVALLLDRMSRTGHRGNLIPTHRAIARLRLPGWRLLRGAFVALVFTALLIWLQPVVTAGWNTTIVWWLHAMNLPVLAAGDAPAAGDWLNLPQPGFDVAAHLPAPEALLAHGLLVAVVWWLAGRLPDAGKPACYFMRFAALMHGSSLLFFAVWPGGFAHTVAEHVESGLRQAWALMLLAPWIHLLTYAVFPFPAVHTPLLTTLTLVYLGLLTPLQYALHTAILHHVGVVLMPLLYMQFGAVAGIVGFVALYGWAMTWRLPPREARCD